MTKMRAQLAGLNHCAVAFRSCERLTSVGTTNTVKVPYFATF